MNVVLGLAVEELVELYFCNELDINPNISLVANGGQAGVTTNSAESCTGSSLGAEAGGGGLSFTNTILPEGETPVTASTILVQPNWGSICVGDTAFVNTLASGLEVNYQWEN